MRRPTRNPSDRTPGIEVDASVAVTVVE